MEKRPHLGAPSTEGETQKQSNERPAEDPTGPSRAPKRLRMPYVEDSYPTGREDGNLVDDESLAWPWSLESSETFEGEDTSEISPKREGGASPLTITGSKTPERNDEMDPQNMGESSNQTHTDSDSGESEIENVYLVTSETLQSHPKL